MIKTTHAALVTLMTVVALSLAGPAVAQPPSCDAATLHSCYMMRVPYGLRNQVLQTHGLTLIDEVSPGRPDLVRVAGPAGLSEEDVLAALHGDADVVDAEPVRLESLSETESLLSRTLASTPASGITLSGIYNGAEAAHFTGDVWNGYAAQLPILAVKAYQVHLDPEPDAMGAGVVAIIDTGVDPNHDLLAGALTAGYDFILDQPGASEWSALTNPSTTEQNLQAAADQSFSGIVEGDGVADDYWSAQQPIVDQSFSGIVETESLPSAFGHGTMVAGIVRFIAPAAQIMPLRAFDGQGKGDLSQIVEAIYYAVDNGANVINMSFSVDHSSELSRAVKYAKRNGVVLISSAGNEGSTGLTYPAAYGDVIGVAATTLLDTLSDFSNYGPELVTVGAPGEEVVTLYPGGGYAMAWGSSFSSGFVSGTAALLHGRKGNGALSPVSQRDAEEWIELGAEEGAPANYDPDGDGYGDIGRGLLDSLSTFECGPNGNNNQCPNF